LVCHGARLPDRPPLSISNLAFFPPLKMPFEWHESCAAGRVPSVPNMTNLTDKKHDDFGRKTWTQLIDMADQ
jgi:hypothetical protein